MTGTFALLAFLLICSGFFPAPRSRSFRSGTLGSAPLHARIVRGGERSSG